MARTSENIDAVEELVLSQEDASAPEIQRTVPPFEHKKITL